MVIDVDKHGLFRLRSEFLETYRHRPVPWGFGPLSWVVYKRSYSRAGERWWETCRRVIEGMFTVQRIHCLKHGLAWDASEARGDAEKAYERMWGFKWTPPGRGLWIMGTRHMYERGGAALNNCGFVSTKDLASDYASPFVWLMGMAMLGVGVGFDTRGRGAVTIRRPRRLDDVHVIGDSREGWAEALGRLLSSYTGKATLPGRWDYSAIRPRRTPLNGFGGFAGGPEPLKELIERLLRLYDAYVDKKVDAQLLVDTMNIVGCCVVAGGIRRAAEIAFGDPADEQFLDLKLDPEKVKEYRWVSNNSLFAELNMDYGEVARRMVVNGEPGLFWLDNARAYGRMQDEPTWSDAEAEGSNPCVEQTLWDRELCCLVETYPAHHARLEDYRETLRLAYLYAKTVTLVPGHDPRTNAVMMGNRRIGCSMTGITQAINRLGAKRFYQWCDESYRYVRYLDKAYARRFAVPRSIKSTCVKPSGTVSLLAGATPGVHWDHAPYYLRRMRVAEDHPLVFMCRRAGYVVEPDEYSVHTRVISFPVHTPGQSRRKSDVPLREKIEIAAQMQFWWSDNQVSCTAEFDPETEAKKIPEILTEYESRLKAMALLPSGHRAYRQLPYEEITEQEYSEMLRKLKPLEGELPHELEDRFCGGGGCHDS